MKTKLFIDFDKTIFNTNQVKERLYRIFGQLGFSQAEIDQTYLAESLDGRFSPEGQAERLHQIRPYDVDIAKLKIKSVIFDSARILYPDTIWFLDNINREKFEVNILSFGDVDFQTRKIKHAGIADKFDNIYVTDIEKYMFLRDIVGRDEYFIVIDDKLENLDKISEHFPKSFIIYINRSIDNIDKDIHTKGARVRNLEQAFKYLQFEGHNAGVARS